MRSEKRPRGLALHVCDRLALGTGRREQWGRRGGRGRGPELDARGVVRVRLQRARRGAEYAREQRAQVARVSRTASGCVHSGRPRPAVSAAGVRGVPEASGGRPAHSVHKAEAAGGHAGHLQRGAGASPAAGGRHSGRRKPLQTHRVLRVRHPLRRLH